MKAIREELGFSDWTHKQTHQEPLLAQAVTTLQNINEGLGEVAAAADTIDLQDLGTKVSQVIDSVQMLD